VAFPIDTRREGAYFIAEIHCAATVIPRLSGAILPKAFFATTRPWAGRRCASSYPIACILSGRIMICLLSRGDPHLMGAKQVLIDFPSKSLLALGSNRRRAAGHDQTLPITSLATQKPPTLTD